jgi:hypothetical protein
MALQEFAQANITQANREAREAQSEEKQIEHGKTLQMRKPICASPHSGSPEGGRYSYRKVIGVEEKAFFCEQKKQKTLSCCRPTFEESRQQERKFLVFFKKNRLCYL